MPIPVFSPAIRRKEMDAVLSCLVSGQIASGEQNRLLLEKLAAHVPHCGGFCFREPTVALAAALRALFPPTPAGATPHSAAETDAASVSQPVPAAEASGLGSASGRNRPPTVLMSALAPAYFRYAVEALHFRPWVVDVDPETALPLTRAVEAALPHADLLLLDYPLGNFPDFDFYSRLSLPIIEDVSSAVGVCPLQVPTEETEETAGESETGAADDAAEATPGRVGSLGSYCLLSTEAHQLITTGGGAVVLAKQKGLAAKLKKSAADLPPSARMPDMNAALGVAQTLSLKERLERRNRYFRLFEEQLSKSSHRSLAFSGGATAFQTAFPVVIDRAMDQVLAYTAKKKVETLPAFSDTVIALSAADPTASPNEFPNALSLYLRTRLFPMYELLGREHAQLIAKVLRSLP